MKRNLLLIHLESLNCLNYRMNGELFPALKEIEKHCIVFDQYYATATSTIMVISDLLYGGMEQYEMCSSLDCIPTGYYYSESLLDELKEEGYCTGFYSYLDDNDGEKAEEKHVAGFQNCMEAVWNYDEFLRKFETLTSKQPFAVMLCNYISNLSFNRYVDISKYGANTGYWKAGYQCIDRYCADLLMILNNGDLMKNTMLVFYGDHGDDYWEHGTYNGLVHAIPPYSQLIHTPLFIWDGINRDESEHRQDLLQTTDLKEMIKNMLSGEENDVLPQRKYAFARNAYAAQPIREKSFGKGYSVTDGNYILLVTWQGLEMYDTRMDPSNQNNLLRFFTYQGRVLRNNEDNKILKMHFNYFWSSREQRILRQKFYELVKILREKTIELYKAGERTEDDMQNEMEFGRINYNI